ncbi:hypothetical protein A2U01_0056740, partial [Trifolium medium]|nr:hypothetical protein [Trifolium medium]
IPGETGEPSRRTAAPVEEELNDELLSEELDLVEELQEGTALREAALKQKNSNNITVEVRTNDVPLDS